MEVNNLLKNRLTVIKWKRHCLIRKWICSLDWLNSIMNSKKRKFNCEGVKMWRWNKKRSELDGKNEEILGLGKVYIFHGFMSTLLDTTTLLMYRTDSLLLGVSCWIIAKFLLHQRQGYRNFEIQIGPLDRWRHRNMRPTIPNRHEN